MNKLVLVLGILIVASATAAYSLWRQVTDERERHAAAMVEVRELKEQLRLAMLRPAEPSSAPAPQPAPVARMPAPTAVASPAPAMAAPPPPQLLGPEQMRAVIERQQQMFKDPGYRAAMKTQQKMGLRRSYSDIGAALNLGPEQTEQFLDLLAEQQLQSMEQGQSMRLANDPSNPLSRTDWQQRVEEEQRRKDQEIAALVGETGLQAWKDYQSSLGARLHVRELRAMLDGSTAPLREDQLQPLIDSVAAEQKRQNEALRKEMAALQSVGPQGPADRMSFAKQSVERTASNNQRLRDAAALHLSSEQLARYDQLLNQQLEAAQANLKMMQMQAESGGNVAAGQIVTNGAPYSIAVGPAPGAMVGGP